MGNESMKRGRHAVPLVRPRLWCVLAVALGIFVHQSKGADDLPDELKTELRKIEQKLGRIERTIGKVDRGAIDLALRETRQWIDEFALGAELVDDDPVIVRLDKKHRALRATAQRIGLPAAGGAKKADAASTDARRMRRRAGGVEKFPVDLKNVSFKRNVAPILANACMRCHNGQRRSGDFDASTYASFARTIEPGDPANSHALNLVTGKAEPRMPRGGQTVFPREWVEIWSAWIEQGAKFDGPDPNAPITAYLIDLETQRRQMYAKMSEAELLELHRAEADRHFAIVAPMATASHFESENFIVRSTLGALDTEYVATLAEVVLENLVARFDLPKNRSVWRGKFGINAFADRADFRAFASGVDRYEPEPEEFGYVRLKPEYSYLAMSAVESGMKLDGLVAQQVAAAFLMRLGAGKLPPWAIHGYSRFIAGKYNGRSPALKMELADATRMAADGKGLGEVFRETDPWSEIAPRSASFFRYLDKVARKRVPAFLSVFAQTGNWQRAVAEGFSTSPERLSAGWSTWARAGR